jgi:hypothetical protein
MKVIVHSKLKQFLSKHLVQRLSKIAMPVSVTMQEFKQYWNACSVSAKRNSLIFFSKDLIDLINKTNARLLYCDLLVKKSIQGTQSTSSTSSSNDY